MNSLLEGEEAAITLSRSALWRAKEEVKRLEKEIKEAEKYERECSKDHDMAKIERDTKQLQLIAENKCKLIDQTVLDNCKYAKHRWSDINSYAYAKEVPILPKKLDSD